MTDNGFFKSNYLSIQEVELINKWIPEVTNNHKMKTQEWSEYVEKARRSLRLQYNEIGIGRHRIVFNLNNGQVLKIAITKWGIKSNEKEYRLFSNSPPSIQKHLCPVKEFGYGWIVMDYIPGEMPLKKHYAGELSELVTKFKEAGIRPRDLKKRNLALSNNGELIVIDYGNFILPRM